MLILETLTDLPADEVIRRAREFFTLRFSSYSGFAEESGESHVRFTTEAGDLTLGVGRQGEQSLVRGSTSRMHHELSQFLSTIAPRPEEVRQNVPGPGSSGAG
jgi:hypothetical protein